MLMPESSAADAAVARLMDCLGLPHTPSHGGYVNVDLSFEYSNEAFVSETTALEQDMIRHSAGDTLIALLLWLKCWTKGANVNSATTGTLNSFAWRQILFAHFMDRDLVPCFRDEMSSVSDPPRMVGVNVWRASAPACASSTDPGRRRRGPGPDVARGPVAPSRGLRRG